MITLNLTSNMFLTLGESNCQICNVRQNKLCLQLYSFQGLRDISFRNSQRFVHFKADFRKLCNTCFDQEFYNISMYHEKVIELQDLKVKYDKLQHEFQLLKNQIQEKERESFAEFTSMLNQNKLREHSRVFEQLSVSISEIYPKNKSPVAINSLLNQMKLPVVSLVQVFNESSKEFFVSSLDNLESVIKQDILFAKEKCERLSGVKDSIKKSFLKEFEDGVLKEESIHQMEEDLNLELKVTDKEELLQRIKVVRDKILEDFYYGNFSLREKDKISNILSSSQR